MEMMEAMMCLLARPLFAHIPEAYLEYLQPLGLISGGLSEAVREGFRDHDWGPFTVSPPLEPLPVDPGTCPLHDTRPVQSCLLCGCRWCQSLCPAQPK